ncbi:RNA polymerase sigma factor [Allorhodopirellula solitaria]|uniref:ECF RNA polymerase sigma factor SigK n=1 Tax=Allorhodopirellula solitaria TaxID=2527987 RepID=A0A5C5YK60_9BACT|nr:RNA polymerase sigma factor [Allorhodopirellula solitaria]TWT75242.1 ECF RNA polymerase sigma factor SigK [Allorhodopirellula solitaria]
MTPQRLCEIWDDHHARLLLITRSIAGGVTIPILEDAVQDAFIELAKRAVEPDDVLGWLARVARNRMLDSMRSESRRQQREIAHGEQCWFTPPVAPPNLDHPPPLEPEQLSRAIKSLPDLPRQVLTMHVWGEMTFESIAEVLGLSRSSAHRHYHRALDTLRNQFQEDSHVAR